MKEGKKVLEKIRKERGFVQLSRKIWADYDPRSLAIYHEMFMHIMGKEKKISRKMKEMIIIAVDAGNLYEIGLEVHFRSALKMGITAEEIFEVLETASVVGGVHVLALSLPILDRVLKERKNKK